MLQFLGPPKDEWRRAVEAVAAEFIQPHPPNAYLVRMTPEQAALAEAEDFECWVGPYHPAFKIARNLAEILLSGGHGNMSEEIFITIYDDRQTDGTVEE